MSSPERLINGAERTAEIEKTAGERSKELLEKSVEHNEHDKSAEAIQEAREEAEKQARKAEDYRPSGETERPANFAITKSPDKTYKESMSAIQRQMSGPSRTFSKVIHAKAIEKTSDVVGATIARPNAILSGSICAFLLVLALYAHARYLGYSLTGFETIGAFILGWIIGIAFDFVRLLIRDKR